MMDLSQCDPYDYFIYSVVALSLVIPAKKTKPKEMFLLKFSDSFIVFGFFSLFLFVEDFGILRYFSDKINETDCGMQAVFDLSSL